MNAPARPPDLPPLKLPQPDLPPPALPQSIGLGDLERAINRAREALPSSGTEHALSADVAVLGGLYGLLIYGRLDHFSAAALTDKERAALARWWLQ